MFRLLKQILHRAFSHAHELTVALVVEGARAPLVVMLVLVAAVLLAFAAQELLKTGE